MAATQAAPTARAHDPEVEAKLLVIWRDILKVDDISAHSGFFALGGHSLLAVRMLARVRDQFDVNLGIASVYEHPTLTELGSVIAGRLGGAVQEEENWRILPLEKSGTGVPLIAINNAATALAICEGFETKRPSTCVRLFDGTRGIDQTERTFEEIAEEYAKVVREAQPKGPYMLFGICVHGNVALETARILQAQGEEIACVVIKDVWEPHFIEAMFKSRKLHRADRAHTLKRKFKRYRDGNMSFAAFLGSYRLVRMTGILQIAQALRLIDRVKRSDMEAEQERFVDYLTRARDRYKPEMLDFPVLHVVTEDVPDVPGFRPSIGWDHYVTQGKLKSVRVPEVLVHRGKSIGTDQVAKELEIFLDGQ